MDFFSGNDTRTFFTEIENSLRNEVSEMENSVIVSCNLSEWTEYLYAKYAITPITIFENGIKRRITEEKVKQPNVFFGSRYNSDEPEIDEIEGFRILYNVPFEGNEKLFFLKPSTLVYCRFPVENLTPASNNYEYGSFSFSFTFTKQELEDRQSELKDFVDRFFEHEFAKYRNRIENINEDVAVFNSKLKDYTRKCLDEKKAKASLYIEISRILEIPLSLNENAPNTVPITLKKVALSPVSRPQVKPIQYEYMINDSDYNNINNIIWMYGTTMEQTARTYCQDNEEELRDHLIAALNTHYYNAQGETFRKTGKTDINITFENRAAFIGECKIWHGEKLLDDAVKQVLNYSTWKDMKVSIIIFNKENKSFQSVLDSISGWTAKNAKTNLKPKTNCWDCIYYRTDMEIEIHLHIVAFDLHI